MKTCSNCGQTKNSEDFPKRKDSKDGLRGECRECYNHKKTIYRNENIEQDRERKRRFRNNNPEHVKQYMRNYLEENRERHNELSREWDRNNKEKKSEYGRRYRKNNPEKIRESKRRWRQENWEHFRQYQNEYNKNRYHSDPDYRLRYIMREMLRRSFNDKEGRTNENLGYCSNQLRKKIEYQFTEGMSWDNYGDWEIDHKIPVSYLIEKGEKRPWVINALSNLQPMWKLENCYKSNKLTNTGTDSN